MHPHSSVKRPVFWAVLVFLGAGLSLVAQNPAQDHPGQYSQADIENGSRLYGAQCSTCHGPNGDSVGGVDLRRGQFRRAASDEELSRLVTTGIPGTAMPAFKFDASELTGLVAYIRAGLDVNARAVKVGDPGRGRLVFEGRGGCTSCHRVNGKGPRAAPDLSNIGTVRAAAVLQQSVLDPTGSMMPINRPVRVVTRDGKVITGRRLNEDTYTVQLIDDQEHLVSLAKANLREYEILKTARMPAYRDKLSSEELADLVAYLLSLKG